MMHEHFWQERGIYYRTNEMRSGRVALVFIHGLSGSSSAWLPYEPVFDGGYNVICVDMRGHGKSLKPSRYEDYEINTMADDIAALLDHLRVKEYVLVSHSLSTVIALSLLRQRPLAVASVFMSPLYGTQQLLLTRASRAIVAVSATIARLFRYSHRPGIHTDYSRIIPVWDWSPRLFVRELYNTTLHVYLFCLHHLYRQDFDGGWDIVRMPTLVIHGKRDTVSPYWHGKALADRLPHARLALVPQGNHIMPLNNAPEVRQILADFLREWAPAPVLQSAHGRTGSRY